MMMRAVLRRGSSVTARFLASYHDTPMHYCSTLHNQASRHHTTRIGRSLSTCPPIAAKNRSNDQGVEFEALEEAPPDDDQELGFATGDFEQIVVENDDWGKKALDCVMDILGKDDTMELYSFRAISGRKCVDIRLDKITDQYGSPSLDEIGAFSRAFNELFEASVGEEAAGEIEIEVSSPGATRAVKIPHELSRFSSLPMVVCSKDTPEPRIFEFVELIDTISPPSVVWRYADVKANRSLGKGRGLSKKQKELTITIPLEDLVSVNLHIDL